MSKSSSVNAKALNCNPLQNEGRFNWEIISDTVGQKGNYRNQKLIETETNNRSLLIKKLHSLS